MPLYYEREKPDYFTPAAQVMNQAFMNMLRLKQQQTEQQLSQQQAERAKELFPLEKDLMQARTDYYKGRGEGYPYSAPSSNYRIITVKDPLGISPDKVFRIPIASGQPEEIDLGMGQGISGGTPQPEPEKKVEFGPNWFTKPRHQAGEFIKPQTEQKSPYPEYPDAFLENGVWKVMRNGKKYRIEE